MSLRSFRGARERRTRLWAGGLTSLALVAGAVAWYGSAHRPGPSREQFAIPRTLSGPKQLAILVRRPTEAAKPVQSQMA